MSIVMLLFGLVVMSDPSSARVQEIFAIQNRATRTTKCKDLDGLMEDLDQIRAGGPAEISILAASRKIVRNRRIRYCAFPEGPTKTSSRTTKPPGSTKKTSGKKAGSSKTGSRSRRGAKAGGRKARKARKPSRPTSDQLRPKRSSPSKTAASSADACDDEGLWEMFEGLRNEMPAYRSTCKDPRDPCDDLLALEHTMLRLGLLSLRECMSDEHIYVLFDELARSGLGKPSVDAIIRALSSDTKFGPGEVLDIAESLTAALGRYQRDGSIPRVDIEQVARMMAAESILSQPAGVSNVLEVARILNDRHPRLGLQSLVDLREGPQLPSAEKVRRAVEALDDWVAAGLLDAADSMGRRSVREHLTRTHLRLALSSSVQVAEGQCDPIQDFADRVIRHLNEARADGVIQSGHRLSAEQVDLAHASTEEMRGVGCAIPQCAEPDDPVGSVLCRCPHGGLLTLSFTPSGPSATAAARWTALHVGERFGLGQRSSRAFLVGCSDRDKTDRETAAAYLARDVAEAFRNQTTDYGAPGSVSDPVPTATPSHASLALVSAGVPWLRVDRQSRAGWLWTGSDTLLLVGGVSAVSASVVLHDLSAQSRSLVPTVQNRPLTVRARAAGLSAVGLLGAIVVERIAAMVRYHDCHSRYARDKQRCIGNHWR